MKSQRGALVTITGLLLLTCLLYMPHLNRVMFCDEANTLYQYASSLPRAVLSYATPNNHMLHSVAVWAATQIAGTSAPVVRFAAFAAALLAIAVTYRLTARLSSRPAGLAAAAFVATTLSFADFAINARGYTLSLLLTAALLYVVLVSRRPRGYLILAISAALVWVLPSMLLLHAGIVAWLLLDPRRRYTLRMHILPIVFGALIGMVNYAPSIAYGLLGEHFSQFGETDLVALAGSIAAQTFATPFVGAVFAASAVIGLVSAAPRLRRFTLVLVGVTLLVSAVQLLLLDKLFWTRNYLYLIVPFAVIAGIGFSRVIAPPALAAALIVVAFAVFPSTFLDGSYNEKTLMGLLDRNLTPTDRVIAAPCFNAPVQHYLIHTGRADRLFSTPDTERVFVVLNIYTLPEVLAMFDAQADVDAASCQPASDGSWNPFEVMVCAAP